MDSKLKQCAGVKLCFKSGYIATDTFKLLQKAYSCERLSRTMVFEWFGRFCDSRASIDDDPREGSQKLDEQLGTSKLCAWCRFKIVIVRSEYSPNVFTSIKELRVRLSLQILVKKKRKKKVARVFHSTRVDSRTTRGVRGFF